jgi:hypothetical protein
MEFGTNPNKLKSNPNKFHTRWEITFKCPKENT